MDSCKCGGPLLPGETCCGQCDQPTLIRRLRRVRGTRPAIERGWKVKDGIAGQANESEVAGARGELTSPDAIRSFMLAGKATLTVENQTTGNRFTFRVSAPDREPGDIRPIVNFVGLLNGPDNNTADYAYMGLIGNDGGFRLTAKSRVGSEALSYKAFAWLWQRVNTRQALPPAVHVYHEGRCGRCGRMLTVPESITSGFGPECAEKMEVRS